MASEETGKPQIGLCIGCGREQRVNRTGPNAQTIRKHRDVDGTCPGSGKPTARVTREEHQPEAPAQRQGLSGRPAASAAYNSAIVKRDSLAEQYEDTRSSPSSTAAQVTDAAGSLNRSHEDMKSSRHFIHPSGQSEFAPEIEPQASDTTCTDCGRTSPQGSSGNHSYDCPTGSANLAAILKTMPEVTPTRAMARRGNEPGGKETWGELPE